MEIQASLSSDKKIIGSIQFNDFYIKISDLEYQEPWTNKSGKKNRDYFSAEMQIKFDDQLHLC